MMLSPLTYRSDPAAPDSKGRSSSPATASPTGSYTDSPVNATMGDAAGSRTSTLPLGRCAEPLGAVETLASRGIATLVLDPDGVLYDETHWRRWLFQLLSRMGMYSHYAAFASLWETEFLARINLAGEEEATVLARFLRGLGFSAPQIDEVLVAGLPRRRELEESLRPLPHVRSTLQELSRGGIQLAVCSCGPWTTEQVTQRMSRLGLSDLFIVIDAAPHHASDDGTSTALAATLGRLDASPATAGLVSARRRGLQAALSIGATAIAVNVPCEGTECVTIRRFEDLTGILTACESASRAG